MWLFGRTSRIFANKGGLPRAPPLDPQLKTGPAVQASYRCLIVMCQQSTTKTDQEMDSVLQKRNELIRFTPIVCI